MKNIQLLTATILLLTIFSFSKCKKEPNNPIAHLSPETQTGANTFGCKINGEIYTARALGACYNYLVQYYKRDSSLLIKTNNTCASGLNINVYGISEIKDYQIFNPISNAYYYNNSNTNCNLYARTNSSQTGIVTITKFDLINKIVSGRFTGVLKQNGCLDIIITEGRFDFIMTVYN